MPLVTIHTQSGNQTKKLQTILDDLRKFTAKKLSSSKRTLDPSEVSIRIIESKISKPISEVEVVIIAYSYPDRVENQDMLCIEIKKFIESNCKPLRVFVWLQLSELGHSLEE